MKLLEQQLNDKSKTQPQSLVESVGATAVRERASVGVCDIVPIGAGKIGIACKAFSFSFLEAHDLEATLRRFFPSTSSVASTF